MNAVVTQEQRSVMLSMAERYGMDYKAFEVISRRSEVDAESGCWNWIGALTNSGYGQVTFEGHHCTAHRFAFAALGRGIPKGKWVLHTCDNRQCVNPNHLYAGTPIDNRRDALERGRWRHPYKERLHCARGHLYGSDTFRIAKDGSRVCRICMKEHMRQWRLKNVRSAP